jgi:lysophospholipase L1-like esterase
LGGVTAATLFGELAWAYLQPAPDLDEYDASCRRGSPGNPPLRLVAVGDSSTTGTGLQGPEEIWLVQVAERLADRYAVDVRSHAIGGATARTVIEDQLDAAVADEPDVAFVSVGANDALRAVPVRAFEERLDHIVARLAATGADVVLSGVGDLGTIPRLLPPWDRVISRHGLRYDHAHARVAARRGVHKTDMWGAVEEIFRTRPDVFAADRFHPTVVGHRAWADAVVQVVEPLLEARGAG